MNSPLNNERLTFEGMMGLRDGDGCRKILVMGSVWPSPMLSNILLTAFDREMRRKGYRLTRYADDWVVACRSAAEGTRGIRCSDSNPAGIGRDAECAGDA